MTVPAVTGWEHFDLIKKFNEGYRYFDESSDAYLEPALAAMKSCIDRDCPLRSTPGLFPAGTVLHLIRIPSY